MEELQTVIKTWKNNKILGQDDLRAELTKWLHDGDLEFF
jgi:hypothetical protein